MKKLLTILTLIFLVACNEENTTIDNLSENGEIAKKYVESLGYEVVAFENEEKIIFTKQEMGILPSKQFWSVQNVEPINYLGKELVQINFLVQNHPLANMFESEEARVSIIMWNEEIIGGTSFPYSKEPLVGGVYSIEGKSGEDVKDNYMQWSEDWDKEYGNK